MQSIDRRSISNKAKVKLTACVEIRSSTGNVGGQTLGNTVSPPSSGPKSDIYRRIVAKRFPPVPEESKSCSNCPLLSSM